MNFCFVSFLVTPTDALFLENEILGYVKKKTNPNKNHKNPSQLPRASLKKFKMEGSRWKT